MAVSRLMGASAYHPRAPEHKLPCYEQCFASCTHPLSTAPSSHAPNFSAFRSYAQTQLERRYNHQVDLHQQSQSPQRPGSDQAQGRCYWHNYVVKGSHVFDVANASVWPRYVDVVTGTTACSNHLRVTRTRIK